MTTAITIIVTVLLTLCAVFVAAIYAFGKLMGTIGD
jgi:hypothetical protein